jgi:pantoate--beta-alanine ligase
MIDRLSDPHAAQHWCAASRASGASLGFVPTMGALHEGHLTLVRRARSENARVCVSVFVNPLQFNDARDFERYPRDFEGDARLLHDAGCDMVFTGTLAQFFPGSDGVRERIPTRAAGRCALGVEGAHRPGHFDGVATIVARLFELVRPARAYFGAKDFQQTLVVRDLARELGFPEVVVCPTSREASGLARSSRNALLSASERELATTIFRALSAARDAWWNDSERSASALAARMQAAFENSSLIVEYAEVRDPQVWTELAAPGKLERAVALIAARAGSVRLIDNMRLDEAGARTS